MLRIRSTVLICALGFSGILAAQTPTDNTKVNQRDRDSAKPTADQQKQTSADIELTSKIRKLITQDKGLSTYAQNVKVIAQDGNVTLRGPVRDALEKKSVEDKATQIAGAGHVKSEIEIAAKETTTNKK